MPQSFAAAEAAESAARDALHAQARRSAVHQLKRRARAFARRPMALETLYPGLAVAPAARVIAIATHLLESERQAGRRWFGFGGEVTALNAKAALLYGRVRRRARPEL